MAYIPPHKRQANRNPIPSPVPSSPSAHHCRRQNPNLPTTAAPTQGRKIVYAPHCITRWWPTAQSDFHLESFDCETIERRGGAKPLAVSAASGDHTGAEAEGRLWTEILNKVARDLIEAGQFAREETERFGMEEVKLSVVARIGKVLFLGDSSVCLDWVRRATTNDESQKSQVHKTFYTNLPDEYMRYIEKFLVEKFGFEFESEKEHYHVKIFDKHRPDTTISCKCTVQNDGGLQIYKIELNQVRYMVADISCINKDLDLRLMLNTKRILKNLDEGVENGVNQLINSAIMDREVKGGLRWPLGKETVGDRFSIVGVWHTNFKAFINHKIRLKLRQADRFDHRTSSGEAANEVTFKLNAVSEQLTEGNVEEGKLVEMIQGVVKLIWENFLSCNKSM